MPKNMVLQRISALVAVGLKYGLPYTLRNGRLKKLKTGRRFSPPLEIGNSSAVHIIGSVMVKLDGLTSGLKVRFWLGVGVKIYAEKNITALCIKSDLLELKAFGYG